MSFADHIALLFFDGLLTTGATYRPAAGTPFSVRVITKQPDTLTGFGGGHIQTSTTLVDIQARDVPQPAVGDVLTIDGVDYVIQSEPTADRDRLIWTLNLVPQ